MQVQVPVRLPLKQALTSNGCFGLEIGRQELFFDENYRSSVK